jgi:virginiamycin B lyase
VGGTWIGARRRLNRIPLVTALVALLVPVVVTGAPPAAANPNVMGFPTPGLQPLGIAVGPDGDLWFTNLSSKSIGRMTTAGVVTDFSGVGIDEPTVITPGADGALWFTNYGNNTIGRITTAGVVSNYTDPSLVGPNGITAGPDGAFWFANSGAYDTSCGCHVDSSIGRISTAGMVTTYIGPGISEPNQITAGPDGALWFTNFGDNSIGRITTAGVVTDYTGTGISFPYGITVGADGALWFANDGNGSIGRITISGHVKNYTARGLGGVIWIAAGPDGSLYFSNEGTNVDTRLYRLTTTGTITPYTGRNIVYGITPGPDGAMWITTRPLSANLFTIKRVATPPYAAVSPSTGPVGTAVTISGGGYSPGETVNVVYKTGLAAPNPAKVTLCTTIATDGTFTCTASIPASATAGAAGAHKINATGTTSLNKATITFTLTQT